MSYRIAPSIINAAKTAAKDAGIDPALLLSVISVETNGEPFEADGKRPVFLPEGAIFYDRLHNTNERTTAVHEGIAWPHYDPARYRTLNSTAAREARLAAMVKVNEAVAYESISCGLFQLMGFNAREAGFADAKDMFYSFVGNTEAQIAAGVAFLKSTGIEDALKRHDWKDAARRYNGVRYRTNNYDAKLADAYAHWHVVLASGQIVPPSDDSDTYGLGSSGPGVKKLQQELIAKGYPCRADGSYGPKTMGAVAAFQTHHGLPGDGIAGPNTVSALESADPLPEGSRDLATVKTLGKTSRIVHHGWYAKRAVEAVGAVGFLGQIDLGGVTDTLDKLDSAKSTYGRIVDALGHAAVYLPHVVLSPVVIGGIAATIVAWSLIHSMEKLRVDDEKTGATT